MSRPNCQSSCSFIDWTKDSSTRYGSEFQRSESPAGSCPLKHFKHQSKVVNGLLKVEPGQVATIIPYTTLQKVYEVTFDIWCYESRTWYIKDHTLWTFSDLHPSQHVILTHSPTVNESHFQNGMDQGSQGWARGMVPRRYSTSRAKSQ